MIGRIYCKFLNQKKFRALDLKSGGQVGNLIHATTFWNELELNQARSILLPSLKNQNPTVEFELRTVSS